MIKPGINVSAEARERIQNDGDLCSRIVAGDIDAGVEFYEGYHHLAHHFGNIAARNCRTGVVDEEDLSQEALIYMFAKTRQYDTSKNVPFWIS